MVQTLLHTSEVFSIDFSSGFSKDFFFQGSLVKKVKSNPNEKEVKQPTDTKKTDSSNINH